MTTGVVKTGWFVVLLAAVLAPVIASAQLGVPPAERDTAPSVEEERQPTDAPRFSLGLEDLDVERTGSFSLFSAPPDAVDVVVDDSARVDLSADLSAALIYTADDRVPEALKMNLKPRTWGDFTGWEKVGYVLKQTGAAVGAAYLLHRLVD